MKNALTMGAYTGGGTGRWT